MEVVTQKHKHEQGAWCVVASGDETGAEAEVARFSLEDLGFVVVHILSSWLDKLARIRWGTTLSQRARASSN